MASRKHSRGSGAALGRGRTLGLPAYRGPLLAVCTHSGHDACCAERGLPIAKSLFEHCGDYVWRCSHLGGDRFAGNMLAVDAGLYYGGLDPDAALAVAEAHANGRLHLEYLRGRTCLPMHAQYAEVQLRRHLGHDQHDQRYDLSGATMRENHFEAQFLTPAGTFAVTGRRVIPPPAQLTCAAHKLSSPGYFHADRITQVA